ncbi:MAG: hypothetical protein KC646_09295 [Candidatus Cloacimonetes bacterium]|nr:hypothetical protein [Candidatus Cloacimonadota bacterium]
MNQLIQHILKKCRLPLHKPDPFLFASMNIASPNALVVCDLDSTLSDWLLHNQSYFKGENVLWTAFNSHVNRDGIFGIFQKFMDQKVEQESVDFQIVNYVLANFIQLEKLQKVAYCCKKNGRFIAREVLWFDENLHERYLPSQVSKLAPISDEQMYKNVMESGFSKCSISRQAYPIPFTSLNDFDKWIRELLTMLDMNKSSFLGFSKAEAADEEFQSDFIESQEIVIREIFAVK